MSNKESFKLDDKEIKKLFDVLATIDDRKVCKDFLLDLCTPSELKSLADRWAVANLIDKGINYREISSTTGASTATVTRVGRSLKFGNGGYKKVMELTSKKAKK